MIYYWGQYVALAVAETFQQAQAAAAAGEGRVRRETGERRHRSERRYRGSSADGEQARRCGGRVHSAAVKVDEVYTTPPETHNPMEMHATTAVWNDGEVHTL